MTNNILVKKIFLLYYYYYITYCYRYHSSSFPNSSSYDFVVIVDIIVFSGIEGAWE